MKGIQDSTYTEEELSLADEIIARGLNRAIANLQHWGIKSITLSWVFYKLILMVLEIEVPVEAFVVR